MPHRWLVLGWMVAACGVAEVDGLGLDARRPLGADGTSDPRDAGPLGAPDRSGPIGGDPSGPIGAEPGPVGAEPAPYRHDLGVPEPFRGSEGALCRSDRTCDVGLLCAEWPATDPTNPVRTCVRPCTDDDACSTTTQGYRHCRSFVVSDPDVNDPAPSAPIMGICSGVVSSAGLECWGSRRGNRVVTGCSADETCMTHRIGDDQGTCAQLCIPTPADPSGGCSEPTPHCNPGAAGLVVESSTGAAPLGVCTVRPIGPGEACSRTDLTRSCDLSAHTVTVPGNAQVCIGFPDLPDGDGVCVETCARSGGACSHVEPGARPAVCTPYVPEADDHDLALCVDGCSNLPDTCGGAGALGQGRFCQAEWRFDQNFPLSLCVDRRTPALAAGVFTGGVSGNPVLAAYEDCRPGVASEGDAYRCPEGTFCLTLMPGAPGQGACARGCATSTAAPSTCEAGEVCVMAEPLDPTGAGGLCVGP